MIPSLPSLLRATLAALMIAGAGQAAAAQDTVPAVAKATEVAIPNRYQRTLTSKANGITYRMSIFLPKNYNPADQKRYPVFYFVPDAFGIYWSQKLTAQRVGD